jgi:hypothetical protein
VMLLVFVRNLVVGSLGSGSPQLHSTVYTENRDTKKEEIPIHDNRIRLDMESNRLVE